MMTCTHDGCSRPAHARQLCSAHYRAMMRTDPAVRHRLTAWWAARRDLVNAIKLERGCVDCGYRDHPAALQFDHREPTEKSFVISSAIGRAWDQVLAEIEKCDVRCANCHAIRTDRTNGGRPTT